MNTEWHSHACTDPGHVRDYNEDAVLELGAERMWCVADGMGGHHDGAWASGVVVETLLDYRDSRHRGVALARLEALVRQCNEAMLRRALDTDVDVVGCTVAVLSLHDRSALVSWSGDARVYRVRRGQLLGLSRDHSVGAESDDRDRYAFAQPIVDGRAALTAAVGAEQRLRLEHGWFNLEQDDRFVLCTDGLVKEVCDEEICDDLGAAESAEAAVAALVARYHERGARDNLGVVAVIGVGADVPP